MGTLDDYRRDLWEQHGDGSVHAHVGKYEPDAFKALTDRIAKQLAEARPQEQNQNG